MEGLEQGTATATQPAPATGTAPVSAPAPQMPSETMDMGDSSSGGSMGSVKEVLSSLNWVEIAFGVLGAAALYYTIYYYKFTMMNGKAVNTEIQNKLDDLSIKVADLQSASQRDDLLGTPQQGFDGLFYN